MNQRPLPPQGSALPICATPSCFQRCILYHRKTTLSIPFLKIFSVFLNFFIFCRKKLSIDARGGTIESFFLHFYKNNYLQLCVAFWQSAFWKSCVSPVGPPLPCRFPRIRMILFAVLYIIYKLLRFVSFVLFF